MVGLIQDPDTINGWFLFDNSADNASQEVLLKNQTVYEQMSHIHGDLGNEMIRFILFSHFSVRCICYIWFTYPI
jgi:hypothetical protein